MIEYYDIHGMPISMERWIDLFDQDRRVGFSRLWGDEEVAVSTVWLGLDHNFSGVGPPLIFETLVMGGDNDGMMVRYSTLEDATRGHGRVVEDMLERMPGARVEEDAEM